MSRRGGIGSVKYFPPRPGVYGWAVITLLQRQPYSAWPLGDLVRSAGVPAEQAFAVMRRLSDLGLVETRSRDSIVRFMLTPRGRRARP